MIIAPHNVPHESSHAFANKSVPSSCLMKGNASMGHTIVVASCKHSNEQPDNWWIPNTSRNAMLVFCDAGVAEIRPTRGKIARLRSKLLHCCPSSLGLYACRMLPCSKRVFSRCSSYPGDGWHPANPQFRECANIKRSLATTRELVFGFLLPVKCAIKGLGVKRKQIQGDL